MVGRAATVLLALVALAACASGPRYYNVYVEASAGLATTTIDDDHAFGPMVGAHLGVSKETEHSDGLNVHMGPSALAVADGTDWRTVLAFLAMHLDATTSRTEDGSVIRRWATIVEGPAMWFAGSDNAGAAAVSIASGPAREWRATNGLLAGAAIMARGIVGGHSTAGAGVELRVRIGIADRPRRR